MNQFQLSIQATPEINPDDRGRAAPIVVRLYELKADGIFKSADFFSLQTRDKTLLMDELIQRDEFQLRPGEQHQLTRKPDPATKAFGVIAAYRDLPNSVWRAVYTLPPVLESAWYQSSPPPIKLNIELEANAVKFAEEKK